MRPPMACHGRELRTCVLDVVVMRVAYERSRRSADATAQASPAAGCRPRAAAERSGTAGSPRPAATSSRDPDLPSRRARPSVRRCSEHAPPAGAIARSPRRWPLAASEAVAATAPASWRRRVPARGAARRRPAREPSRTAKSAVRDRPGGVEGAGDAGLHRRTFMGLPSSIYPSGNTSSQRARALAATRTAELECLRRCGHELIDDERKLRPGVSGR